jgi:hypothetical protein
LKRRRCRVIAWNYLWGWTMEEDGCTITIRKGSSSKARGARFEAT